MKLYFIAGENSGDFIGAKIINSIPGKDVKIFGVGGSEMKLAGMDSLFDFQKINLMGFAEVVPRIFHIKKLIDYTINDIISKKPDILVTIDSPGFPFRVAQKIKILAPKIKLVHIVAPSVWAYKENRAQKYAKIYDKLLTLFPFEPPYFTKYGLECECIGHPVLEQKYFPKTKKMSSRSKIIAITPGSRKNEISRHMPIIRQALDELSNLYKIDAIFVQPSDEFIEYIKTFLNGAEFSFKFSTDRLKTFAISDVALAKSGTNTIEIAASETPMIVGYKLNFLTYILIRMCIKIRYVSIINIIGKREIIPEYIQHNFTAKNITKALNLLLVDDICAGNQVKDAIEVLKSLGYEGEKPSQKAWHIIRDLAKRS